MRLTIQIDPTSRGELTEAIRQLTLLRDGPAAASAPPQAPEPPVVEPPAAEIFKPVQEVAPSAPLAPLAPIAAAAVGTPPAPAPAPVVSAPAGATGVELDKSGLPWDGRIHSSTKAKNADGSWRAKRGLNDGGLTARVEAELRAAMAAPAATAPAVPLPPPAPSFPPSAGASEVPPVPPIPPVAVSTFPEFMKRIIPLMQGNPPQITRDEVTAVLAARGIGGLPLLAPRPDLIPEVWADIEALRLSKPSTPAAALPPGATLQ